MFLVVDEAVRVKPVCQPLAHALHRLPAMVSTAHRRTYYHVSL